MATAGSTADPVATSGLELFSENRVPEFQNFHCGSDVNIEGTVFKVKILTAGVTLPFEAYRYYFIRIRFVDCSDNSGMALRRRSLTGIHLIL